MEIKTKYNAGDKVWIGSLIDDGKSWAFGRVSGPFLIDKVNIAATAEKGDLQPKESLEVTYTIGGTNYWEKSLHRTASDSQRYVDGLLAPIEEKRTKEDADRLARLANEEAERVRKEQMNKAIESATQTVKASFAAAA